MKTSSPLGIVIPLLVAGLIIAGVMAWRTTLKASTSSTPSPVETSVEDYPAYTTESEKSSGGLDSEVSDLSTELSGLEEDDGLGELESLESDLESLE
jgi:hypothetical protein